MKNYFLKYVIFISILCFFVFNGNITRQVFAAEQWYKGNLHTHSINSDGSDSPQDLVNWYANWYADHYPGRGYSFLAITDHNTNETDEYENAAVDYGIASTPDFLVLTGLEVSDGKHVNGIGLTSKVHGGSLQASIDAINGASGIAMINHPMFSSLLTADDILETSNCQLMEIANMTTARDIFHDIPGMIAYDVGVWDDVLSAGHVMYGVASDDSHWISYTEGNGQSGLGWIVVRAPALTQTDILNAIENGNFYSSTGIVLNDYLVNYEAGTITIDTQNGDTITFVGNNGVTLQTVSASSATYQVTGNEYYVRAYITNANGDMGWTQPIFVSDFQNPPSPTPTPTVTPTPTNTPTPTPTPTATDTPTPTTPVATNTPTPTNTPTNTPTLTPTPTQGSANLIWYSTLNNSAAITSPATGTAGTVSSGTTFVAAHDGNGLQANSNSHYFSLPTSGNFNAARGTIEFWYKPAHASTDGAAHVFFDGYRNSNNTFYFEKNSSNELQFTIKQGGTSISKLISSANYSWSAGNWVFLRVEWDNSIPSPYTNQLRIFVNGVEPANYFDHINFSSTTYIGTRLYVPGTWGTAGADGIIDEFKIHNAAL